MNSVVGTVSYPNIGCTYDFRLVSAQPDRVTLFEQVTSGLCQSEYVVLTPTGSGIAENASAGPPSGGQPDFAGGFPASGDRSRRTRAIGDPPAPAGATI